MGGVACFGAVALNILVLWLRYCVVILVVVYFGLVVELLCSPVGGWFIGVDSWGLSIYVLWCWLLWSRFSF